MATNANKDKEKEQAQQTAAPTPTPDPVDDTKAGEDDPEELVEYMAPVILGKTDQTVFCQVNGENIRIQRGKKVKIKRKFKEVLDNAAEQEMAAFTYMEEAQKGSSKALADLN